MSRYLRKLNRDELAITVVVFALAIAGIAGAFAYFDRQPVSDAPESMCDIFEIEYIGSPIAIDPQTGDARRMPDAIIICDAYSRAEKNVITVEKVSTP
jgi:hypothetical protein